MASIVFVHGSGIRAERYERLLHNVRQGLRAAGCETAVAPCAWGDRHGSRLLADGASLGSTPPPPGDGSGSPGLDVLADPELAGWVMAEQPAGAPEQPTVPAPTQDGPDDSDDSVTVPASLWSQLAAGLSFRPAGLRLGASLLTAPRRGGSLLGVTLRSASLQEAGSAFGGDIALYLSRGADIRDDIRGVIAAAEPPVTVLAHSLGGVACVDLLAADAAPQVDLLVTVGTQVGFLYEIDALPGLRFGQPLPGGFPQWVNVLDRRDALAYLAGPLFPGRVVDRLVDNRAPFPLAHTAYFGNTRFYRILAELLDPTGSGGAVDSSGPTP